MPLTTAVPKVSTDPGYLLYAPLGTAEPPHTVEGSVFTGVWPAAWIMLGATEEGHNFTFTTSTEMIEAAEFYDPIKYVSSGRTGSYGFALLDIKATNLRRALNGGTLTTTGLTTTTMTRYTPPAVGQEIRCMIGWESQDSTERLICFQTFNTAGVTIARRKGAAKATIPVEFALELAPGGQPFEYITAGVDRA